MHGCDIVATSGDDSVTVVIVELKQSFNLELVLQGVERTAACDEVWLAVRASRKRLGREYDRRVWKLCRFLGFELLAITNDWQRACRDRYLKAPKRRASDHPIMGQGSQMDKALKL